MKEIIDLLFSKQDTQYRAFQAHLIPNVDEKTMIGVRTPELKKIAKEIKNTPIGKSFIKILPHFYFEEYQLQAFIISDIKEYSSCLTEVNRFLPHVNNWATCDQLCPKIFVKHKDELIKEIKKWLTSKHLYTKRFAIKMLMSLYLDEDFKEEYLKLVSKIKSEEYYLNMIIAWYFATALAKQYDSTIKYLEEKKLSPWVHNKTIQKALESYRISNEQKAYLRSLKIKSK